MFNKRVLKLERVFQTFKDASDPQIIITPIGMTEGNLAVKTDGKTLFLGKPEECDLWIDKNIGSGGETILVGVNMVKEEVYMSIKNRLDRIEQTARPIVENNQMKRDKKDSIYTTADWTMDDLRKLYFRPSPALIKKAALTDWDLSLMSKEELFELKKTIEQSQNGQGR